jgi:hypothetical protein
MATIRARKQVNALRLTKAIRSITIDVTDFERRHFTGAKAVQILECSGIGWAAEVDD